MRTCYIGFDYRRRKPPATPYDVGTSSDDELDDIGVDVHVSSVRERAQVGSDKGADSDADSYESLYNVPTEELEFLSERVVVLRLPLIYCSRHPTPRECLPHTRGCALLVTRGAVPTANRHSMAAHSLYKLKEARKEARATVQLGDSTTARMAAWETHKAHEYAAV